MFEDLNRIVEGRTEPTMLAGIYALAAALERHDAVLWKDKITNLVMIGDNEDHSTLVERVIGILYEQSEALLQQMLIVIDFEDLRIGRLAEIIDALFFEPGDQDQEIALALGAADDPESALMDVLAIKTGRVAEEFMEFILEVDPTTIDAIAAVVNRSLDTSDVEAVNNEVALGLMNKHQTLVNGDLTMGMESLNEGVPVGTKMSLLWRNKQSALADLTPQQAVDELISLALLAVTPPDSLEDEVSHFLEQLYPDDIFKMQQARKHLLSRIGGLSEDF